MWLVKSPRDAATYRGERGLMYAARKNSDKVMAPGTAKGA